MEDINAFIEAEKNEFYFLGSIIINNDYDKEDNEEKLYVIDGQQRVTTSNYAYVVVKGDFIKD